jgi:glycosyltransferase involved in cell wall biosynthesis
MDAIKKAKKKKLFFVVTEDWYFVSHRFELAIAACEAGYDVTLVTRVRKHGQVIRDAGIRIIPFEMSRRAGNPVRELLALTLIYRRERPDIVHHVALKPILYGSIAVWLGRVPAQVNAVAGLGWLFISRSGIARFMSLIIRRLLSRFLSGPHCRVIVQNPDDKALLEKTGIPESRLSIIRGAGVNTSRFVPTTEGAGKVLVILAARILWDKGVGEFVEAAKILKEDAVNIRCILVGEPDPDNPAAVPESTFNSWKEEGVVECWGHREDMLAVFEKAHIVCLPSYREGLPKVLIEAAACGKPLVATDVPGCREVVREGGNGFLVPVRDGKALANALRRLVENPELRHQMGKCSREIALKEFASEQVISQTLEIYEELTQ